MTASITRRWTAIALATAATLSLAACGGSDSESDATDGGSGTSAAGSAAASGDQFPDCSAALVLGQGGLGDQSFNDSANAGIERAKAELGVDAKVIESAADTDVEVNLSDAAAEGNTVSFAIGFQMVDPVTNVATESPDSKIGIVDAVVELPNVASLTFNEAEGSFLVGVVAAKMSKTGTIGFVGGLEIPLIERFYAGYAAGAKSVNPDIKVLVNYAGAFDDPARGKEIALSEYSDGADVVFHAAGGTGLGVFEAAKEQDKYVIGVDSDQLSLAPDNTLTSMMKQVDVAVFETIRAACDGSFKGETRVFGLADNGVGLAPTTSTNTPQDVIDLAMGYRDQILAGDIKVPQSAAELESFTPPSN